MPEHAPARALTSLCTVQFTELQQKEQLAKLAMARTDLATAPSARKFKFVSNVNEQVSPGSCCSCPLEDSATLVSYSWRSVRRPEQATMLHVMQTCELV